MVIIDARSLLSSSRDRDSVLAHVHLAEFKLLRKVIQSGGADLVPGDGVAGVVYRSSEKRRFSSAFTVAVWVKKASPGDSVQPSVHDCRVM